MSWEPPGQMGQESADSADLRRLLRMGSRRLRLGFAALSVLIIAAIFMRQPSAKTVESRTEPASAPSGFAVAASTPLPSPTPAPPGYEKYAMFLFKLPGLAPDTPPGTPLKLWVSWQKSVVKGSRLQLLIDDALLGRIEEPYGGEGPLIAELLVRAKQIPDLIYGEKFGSLSVSVVATEQGL